MAEDDFHVHGPHDHAIEHAAHGGDPFSSRVAALTAVLATIGALFSYEAGRTQNDALLYKNQAAIRKTEASDQWNYYQSKSAKQNLAELALSLTSGTVNERYKADIVRYTKEKYELKEKAEALETQSKEADNQSEESMHVHHRWAQAMTALQVAISLAAITLLSRRVWMQWTAIGVAVAGCAIGAMAAFHI
ncbi:MAG TPA: DUF4337 domain-containing protein [Rugosibacter sp.]